MSDSRTILIIDDDADIRELLQMALEEWGYQVLSAADGNAGEALALSDRPDLIILDMMMPRISGFAVLQRLRQQHRLDVPVIMLSGIESDHQRAYAEFLGADQFLMKPVRPLELLQNVRRLCPLAARDAAVAMARDS
jgi:DNA-binding response OmpR family regulator